MSRKLLTTIALLLVTAGLASRLDAQVGSAEPGLLADVGIESTRSGRSVLVPARGKQSVLADRLQSARSSVPREPNADESAPGSLDDRGEPEAGGETGDAANSSEDVRSNRISDAPASRAMRVASSNGSPTESRLVPPRTLPSAARGEESSGWVAADRGNTNGTGAAANPAPRTTVASRPIAPRANKSGGAKLRGDEAGASDVVISSRGPSLHIETSGPRAIKVGKEADYRVYLVNGGEEVAGEVHVRVALPEWVQVVAAQGPAGEAKVQSDEMGGTRVIWTVDHVAARDRQELSLKVVPRQNRPFELVVDWTFRPASTAAQIEVQQPQLELALFGPRDVLYGESAVFTIVLTNPGTGDAEDVVLSLTPGEASPESKPIGTIAAGAKHEIQVELTARKAGTMHVLVQAAAPGGLQVEAAEEILVRRPQLHLELAGPEARFAGSEATYEVRIANAGNAVAELIEVSVTLPPGAKYIGGIDGAKPTSDGLSWSVAKLTPASERLFEIQCVLVAPGSSELNVFATLDDQEVSDRCLTQVEALADLKLVVNDPQGPRTVGEDVTYELVILNRGSKAAEGVEIVAQFSDGIEPVQASGVAAEIVPGQVVYRPIPRVEPGQQVTLKVTAQASKSGSHRFRAQVTAEGHDIQLVAEATTRFFGAEMVRNPGKSDGTRAASNATPAQPAPRRIVR